jgi:hypothetical protein
MKTLYLFEKNKEATHHLIWLTMCRMLAYFQAIEGRAMGFFYLKNFIFNLFFIQNT